MILIVTHLELAVGRMESNGLETQQSAGLTRKIVEKKTDHDWGGGGRKPRGLNRGFSSSARPFPASTTTAAAAAHDTIGGL